MLNNRRRTRVKPQFPPVGATNSQMMTMPMEEVVEERVRQISKQKCVVIEQHHDYPEKLIVTISTDLLPWWDVNDRPSSFYRRAIGEEGMYDLANGRVGAIPQSLFEDACERAELIVVMNFDRNSLISIELTTWREVSRRLVTRFTTGNEPKLSGKIVDGVIVKTDPAIYEEIIQEIKDSDIP